MPVIPSSYIVGRFPNPKSVSIALGNNKEAQQFLSRGGQVIIRMRGLPYEATAKQVVSFYSKNCIPDDILSYKSLLFFPD